jgi:hypothetical protein
MDVRKVSKMGTRFNKNWAKKEAQTITDLRTELAEAKADNTKIVEANGNLAELARKAQAANEKLEYKMAHARGLNKVLVSNGQSNLDRIAGLEVALKKIKVLEDEMCEGCICVDDCEPPLPSLYGCCKAIATTAIAGKGSACDNNLKEFVREIISVYCWGADELDGCDVQDHAERLGFIAKHTATAEDVDDESDFEVGDTMFKFTDILLPIPPTPEHL